MNEESIFEEVADISEAIWEFLLDVGHKTPKPGFSQKLAKFITRKRKQDSFKMSPEEKNQDSINLLYGLEEFVDEVKRALRVLENYV